MMFRLTSAAARAVALSMSLRTLLFVSFLVVALLALTGVAFEGIATGDWRVLGLPAGLVWTVGWSVATFLAVSAYDLTRPSRADDDA